MKLVKIPQQQATLIAYNLDRQKLFTERYSEESDEYAYLIFDLQLLASMSSKFPLHFVLTDEQFENFTHLVGQDFPMGDAWEVVDIDHLIQRGDGHLELWRRIQAISLTIDEVLDAALDPKKDEDQIRTVIDDLRILSDLADSLPSQDDWYGLWSGKNRTEKEPEGTFEHNIYIEDDHLCVGIRFFGTKEQLDRLAHDSDHWGLALDDDGTDSVDCYFTYYKVEQRSARAESFHFGQLGITVVPTNQGWIVVDAGSGQVEKFEL